MLSYVVTRDFRLMRQVHRWRPPRWFRWWMLAASRAGDGWLWASIGVLILLAGDERRFAVFAAAAASVAVAIAAFEILKRIAMRRRPCELEPHCWATLTPPDEFSFPSGHTMTAFAVAVPVSLAYPELTAAMMLCAVSVGASRIVLGMHFLSDVVAGCCLGAAIGCGSYLLVF